MTEEGAKLAPSSLPDLLRLFNLFRIHELARRRRRRLLRLFVVHPTGRQQRLQIRFKYLIKTFTRWGRRRLRKKSQYCLWQ